MKKSEEQRSHPRFNSAAQIKIYTSLINSPYTVDLKDVSMGGLFVRSLHLPQLGETITYHLIDEAGKKLSGGQGKVVRIRTDGNDANLGFAVEFEGLLMEKTVEGLADK